MTASNFDSVAAAIADDRLSDLLAIVHREGFGHNVQVVRPERGQTSDRLRRAGLESSAIERLIELERPVVLIFAQSRLGAADVVLRRGGAAQVESYRQSSGTQSALIGFDPSVLRQRKPVRRNTTSLES